MDEQKKKSVAQQLEELKVEMIALQCSLAYIAFLKKVGVKRPVLQKVDL